MSTNGFYSINIISILVMFFVATSAHAAGKAGLRFVCEGEAENAIVTINDKRMGSCPMDIEVDSGAIKLHVAKTNALVERAYKTEFEIGEGALRRVVVELGQPTLKSIKCPKCTFIPLVGKNQNEEFIPKFLSKNGKTIVGTLKTSEGMEVYFWTSETGMKSIGRLPGSAYYHPTAINDDASVITGVAGNTAELERNNEYIFSEPFVWTNADGIKSLANDISTSSVITGLNEDGTSMAGVDVKKNAYDGKTMHTGFLWKKDTGKIYFKKYENKNNNINFYPRRISKDGNVIVGIAELLSDPFTTRRVFAYYVNQNKFLYLNGSVGDKDYINFIGMADDASLIVGERRWNDDPKIWKSEVLLWPVNAKVERITESNKKIHPKAVSRNGRFIAGLNIDENTKKSVAFIWEKGNHFTSLEPGIGQLSDYVGVDPDRVSNDGELALGTVTPDKSKPNLGFETILWIRNIGFFKLSNILNSIGIDTARFKGLGWLPLATEDLKTIVVKAIKQDGTNEFYVLNIDPDIWKDKPLKDSTEDLSKVDNFKPVNKVDSEKKPIKRKKK